jgi:hypothetical protein
MAYDIQAGTTTTVSSYQWGASDLYYDKLVWIDSNTGDLWYKNLSKATAPVTLMNLQNMQSYVGIWGDYVIVANMSWGSEIYLNVYCYDVNVMSIKGVASYKMDPMGGAWVRGIDVTGNKAIIYYNNGNHIELRIMDVPFPGNVITGTLPSNTNDCNLAGKPNDLIVCGGNGGYFTYDIPTSNIQTVPVGMTLGESSFSAQGFNLLYTNMTTDNGFNYDLFLFNFQTKTNIRITSTPSMDLNGVIYNDKIAFISSRDGFLDVYFFMMPKNPPDLAVYSWDIKAKPNSPVIGETSDVLVTVYNQGMSPADANVWLTIKAPRDQSQGKIYKQFLTGLAPGSSKTLDYTNIVFNQFGPVEVFVSIKWQASPPNPAELVTDNNDAMTMFTVVDRPTVVINTEVTEVDTYVNVSFDGKTGTTDRDGIMLMIWNFGDGSTSVGSTADHTWKKAGMYQVKLMAYDIYGTVGVGYKNITILDQWPTAVVSVPPVAARNTTIVLSAAGSYDPDGTIIDAWWETDIGVRGGLQGLVVETSFSTPNDSVVVMLHLTDDDWNETTEIFTIQLVDATAHNVPPIAVIQLTGNGLNVSFSGLSSYDTNGKIISYSWVFSDNSTATGPMVNKSFGTGTHIATLKVKDDEGLYGTTTASFTLSYTAPPTIIQKVNQTVINQIKGNVAPKASASFSQVNGTKGLVNFHGTGTDSDGTIVKYEWDFNGDGTWDYTNPTTSDTSYTYDKPGYYMALFRVTDNNGTSTVVSLSIGVRTTEIGAKKEVKGDSFNIGSILLVLIICIVAAIAIAAAVGYVMSKKVATVQKDMVAEQEVAEIKKLVEESKTTGANVDEAEALIRQFEGR